MIGNFEYITNDMIQKDLVNMDPTKLIEIIRKYRDSLDALLKIISIPSHNTLFEPL